MIIFTGGYELCAGAEIAHSLQTCACRPNDLRRGKLMLTPAWQGGGEKRDKSHILRDSAANYLVLPYRDVEYRVRKCHDTRLIT